MRKLPSSDNCYVCGRENPFSLKLEFYVNEIGDVVSEFNIAEEYAGYPGMVHGGNISAILDEIAGRAVTTEDPNLFFVTSELKVKFIKPVPTKSPLIATGRLIKKRGKAAFAESEIRNMDNELLASCEAFFIDLTEKFTEESKPAESGWRVDPDER